jgi:hypothetical protein
VEERALLELSHRIAAAIAARDTAALRGVLAPGFVHRTHGGERSDAEVFLQRLAQIPGEIAFVHLERLVVDAASDWALVTGVQHARVIVDGASIDDRRGFVDWFVKHDNEWRIQAAVDLPAAPVD